MAAHRGRVPRPTQAQEVGEIRRMIGQLAQEVQNLRRQQPEVRHGRQEDNRAESEEAAEHINPFHNPMNRDHAGRGGLEERLARALQLDSGVRVEDDDFHGKMHADDFLDWESSFETDFEWKPMTEERKVLFVKLKLKGIALQWWKRLEEQHKRQGKSKIRTRELMKAKLRKQFLPADYMTVLYKKFHGLKQRDCSVEKYTAEFYNLSTRVGLNETNEQQAARYLSGLNSAIQDEISLEARISNLEDAYQFALEAEERITRLGPRRRLNAGSNQRFTAAVRGG